MTNKQATFKNPPAGSSWSSIVISNEHRKQLETAIGRPLLDSELEAIKQVCTTANGRRLANENDRASNQAVIATLTQLYELEGEQLTTAYATSDSTTIALIESAIWKHTHISDAEKEAAVYQGTPSEASLKRAIPLARREAQKIGHHFRGRPQKGFLVSLSNECARLWFAYGGTEQKAWRSFSDDADYGKGKPAYTSAFHEWGAAFFELATGKNPKSNSSWRNRLNKSASELTRNSLNQQKK